MVSPKVELKSEKLKTKSEKFFGKILVDKFISLYFDRLKSISNLNSKINYQITKS